MSRGSQSENSEIEERTSLAGIFRKSSFCNGDECVLVAKQADCMVVVKGASNSRVQTLTFTRSEWVAFVKGVKNEEFDV